MRHTCCDTCRRDKKVKAHGMRYELDIYGVWHLCRVGLANSLCMRVLLPGETVSESIGEGLCNYCDEILREIKSND